jgi:hypothetical protein
MKGKTFIGLVFVVAMLGVAIPAGADTHAPWPADWNNWSDPNLMVTVGNPGNAADRRYDANGFGVVSYTYRIGKFEVTAGQYCAFLNAVAKTDTYSLYFELMAVAPGYGGCNIWQAGSAGSYSYSVDPNWANRPVNWVDWGDAARFCNWLTNGQPTGAQDANTTEDGSYFLNGAKNQEALGAVTRKTVAQGGRYYIPTEDEWYKAAYYDPNKPGGAGYWDYPTGTNTQPGSAIEPVDSGNNANYYLSGYAIGKPYYRTVAGEFENSSSPYGTYDQGGNVSEWTEMGGVCRFVRGGDYVSQSLLAADNRGDPFVTDHSAWLGFRVSEVPEPASMAILAVGSIGMLMRRRGLRR